MRATTARLARAGFADAAAGWRSTLATQDFRLVPAACSAWLGAILGATIGWQWAVASGLVASLAGCCVLARGVRLSTRGSFRWVIPRGLLETRSLPLAVAGMAMVLCGVAVTVWLAPRLHTRQSNPLRAVAEHGGAVTLRVEITRPGRPVRRAGYGGSPGGVRSELIDASVDTISGPALDGAARRRFAYGDVLLITPVHGWSRLLRGQHVTARGSVSAAEGSGSAVAVVRVKGPPTRVTPPSMPQRIAERFRSGLRTASGVLPSQQAGLLPGLVIGDRSGLSPEVEDDFRTAGMAYLTAVGGWHFMIVCGALLLLLRLLRVPPRLSAILAGLVLLGFLLIAGPRPSVLRAALMVAAGLLAMGTGRGRSTLGALALSVIGLVLWQPSFGADVGFALSVLATGGLLLFVPPVAAALRRRRIPRGFAELIAVAAVAHLVTAPVVAAEFGQFSMVSVFANVAAEPAFVPAMVLGVLAMACAPLSAGVAAFFVQLAGPCVGWLVTVARFAAGLPAASIAWPMGWWGGVALTVVIVVVVALARVRRIRIIAAVLLLAVALVVIPSRLIRPGWPPRAWAIVDCDVGQGDAEVLATADDGRAVVVDTGPDPQAIGACLDRLGVTSVPLVVLTHLHADHVGGLPAVLAGRSVGAVAVGASREPEWAWREVRAETAAARVPLVRLRHGDRLAWPGLAMHVLGPEPEDARCFCSDGTGINNTSVVIKARTKAGTVLLTGDVEVQAQRDLLRDGVDVRADILKIPHHGSRYSSARFLADVHARIAVASAGKGNPYGHPSPVTLRRLRADGALVMETDRDGSVAIVPSASGPLAVARGDPRPPPSSAKGGSR